MKAIKTKHTTHDLCQPVGWDESVHGSCESLPVAFHEGVYYSFWNLTWKERFRVFFGRPIRLCIVGVSHPPVALDTEY